MESHATSKLSARTLKRDADGLGRQFGVTDTVPAAVLRLNLSMISQSAVIVHKEVTKPLTQLFRVRAQWFLGDGVFGSE